MILCTADWHLDDNPDNEYRWAVIEHVLHAVIQHDISTVFILGDTTDRKDRHSGAFVNRLITELRKLTARVLVVILRGNHDTPMRGPAYWEFLSQLENLHYVIKPETWHLFDHDQQPDLMLLPFTASPKQDWSGITLSKFRALFMHATVTGAVTENGQVLENSRFPILPRRVKIYSGDVHVPQQAGGVTYVGAPHPIKFGDNFACRMLLLNESYDIELEVPLHPPRKLMINIANVRELADIKVSRGDQAKIRFKCPTAELAEWGAIERTIGEWATNNGVGIAGTEVLVNSTHSVRGTDIEQTPAQILRQFAAQEHVSEELLNVGLGLLKET